MKTIKISFLYLSFVSVILISCQKKNDETSVAETENTEQITNQETPDTNKNITPVSDRVECVGKVELPPYAKYSIHSKVEGYVRSVRLIEGQSVAKGSVLAIIESPAFAVLQKEFLSASASYELAKDNFERKEKLSKSQSISEKEIKKAEMELKVANAEYIGLKAELELMGFQTSKIEEGQIQKSLAIFSPINGYVTKATINNGQKISSDDLLFEIIDKSNVHIKMQVNSKDVRQLKEGDKFTVILPGEKRKFSGELHYINKRIEAETNTVIIHGHFDNVIDASELLVGSMVFIKF